MKRSKKYKAAAEKIKLDNLYMPGEAMKLVKEIANVKMADLNANDIEAASRIIEGTARSMGITVVD